MSMRALACLFLVGCFGPTTTTCADGTTCPAETVCAPAGGSCVAPDQVAACNGLGENANCTAVVDGVCQSGVCTSTQWTSTAVIGGSVVATRIGLGYPQGAVVDALGNLYIADTLNNLIRRVDRSGDVTTVAGTGTAGFSGDGGAATATQLSSPADVAVDGLHNVYISDRGNQRIRRVDPAGIITTIAGTGATGAFGDGGAAVAAELDQPSGIAVDGFGNVYIADTNNNSIRQIDTSGTITTLATGPLSVPQGVALDPSGNVVIADSGNNRIVELDLAGNLEVLAGTGSAGFGGDDQAAIDAELDSPYRVAIGLDGTIYIGDRSNNRIRRITGGIISTIAGTGVVGFGGDGGAATAAQLADPFSVAVDSAGNVYIGDLANCRVRRVDPTGVITTIAGTGQPLSDGDGGAATAARLDNPHSAVVDGSGVIFVADTSNGLVRRVDTAGVITDVAGTGASGFAGDGGPATLAELDQPNGVAVDGLGNMYIADTSNNRIRKVDANGTITTIAGDGVDGFGGDDGPATEAALSNPQHVAADTIGNIYIADSSNNRVRRVDPNGVITTVAGNGSAGFSGDGGQANVAELSNPVALAIDGGGNVYIADYANNRIRRVDATGVITTVAGTGQFGFSGDGGAATAAMLASPTGVAIDALQQIYIADSSNDLIRRVDATGTITTVAGMPGLASPFFGDGGPATAAQLDYPYDVAVGSNGALYIVGLSDDSVRRVDAAGIITTVVGLVDPGVMGPIAQAQLADPTALVATPNVTFFAGGTSGTIQALVADSLEVVAGRYPQTVPTGSLARFRDMSFGAVSGIAYDAAAGRIYMTESNAVFVVTIVDPEDASTWTLATLTNAAETAGFNDGPAATAELRAPTGLYLDPATDRLIVADTGNHVVRAIDLSSATVSTIAGTPATLGYFGDGGSAGDALLDAPQAITLCANGDLFVADTGNNRVRRIAATAGTITTVLGDGTSASSGQGGPATTLPVDSPSGLACDAIGNLFVTSTIAVRMLLADATGTVDGTGEVRTVYGLPPQSSFPSSVTRCLSGLAVIDPTTLRVTDACTGIMVELQRQLSP